MDSKQLAEKLNGREYGEETSPEEEKLARESGLVIVFGYSDDCCELRGAVDDELGSFDGGEIANLDKNGIIRECSDGCDYYRKALQSSKVLSAKWQDGEYSWTFDIDVPYETFDIMEDGEKYCRGIVFSLDDFDEL